MKLDHAKALCRSLPGATEDLKWESSLVFSVGGKMFAITWNTPEAIHLSIKVDDGRFLELTDRPGIIPAPYLARAKWVRIQDVNTISDAELTELIQRSHTLVMNKLTKKLQREILGDRYGAESAQ